MERTTTLREAAARCLMRGVMQAEHKTPLPYLARKSIGRVKKDPHEWHAPLTPEELEIGMHTCVNGLLRHEPVQREKQKQKRKQARFTADTRHVEKGPHGTGLQDEETAYICRPQHASEQSFPYRSYDVAQPAGELKLPWHSWSGATEPKFRDWMGTLTAIEVKARHTIPRLDWDARITQEEASSEYHRGIYALLEAVAAVSLARNVRWGLWKAVVEVREVFESLDADAVKFTHKLDSARHHAVTLAQHGDRRVTWRWLPGVGALSEAHKAVRRRELDCGSKAADLGMAMLHTMDTLDNARDLVQRAQDQFVVALDQEPHDQSRTAEPNVHPGRLEAINLALFHLVDSLESCLTRLLPDGPGLSCDLLNAPLASPNIDDEIDVGWLHMQLQRMRRVRWSVDYVKHMVDRAYDCCNDLLPMEVRPEVAAAAAAAGPVRR